MPKRAALAPILMLPLLLAACTGTPAPASKPYPTLLPLEQILGTQPAVTDPGPALAARGAALRGRARALRAQD